MCFIYYIAHKAIKAINKTESQISDAMEKEKDDDFLPPMMKKKFNKRDNRKEELQEKRNQMRTSQHLAIISVITMLLICSIAAMCLISMTSREGVRYRDIKVFMVISSLYVTINPVIYMLTMSKIRFFIRKDFVDWKENNALRSITFRRSRRRVAPSSI